MNQMVVLDTDLIERLSAIFAAMSDPTRLRIITILAQREMPVGELARVVGNKPSATSHQLHLLRRMRIARSRECGREVLYSLDDGHVRDLLDLAIAHIKHCG